MIEGSQQPSDQGGLARAQIPLQVDHQSRMDLGGQGGPENFRGGAIRQVQGGGCAVIIGGMDGIDHRGVSREQGEGVQGWVDLRQRIDLWAMELGFDGVRIADIDLEGAAPGLAHWLAAGFHGDMDYMAKHGAKRWRPDELVPGTRRVICARMAYLPDGASALENLAHGERAYISRYALGRDYHKVLRNRLQKLAERIAVEAPHGFRVFVDSAPVMEVALASGAGLGWRGKHTLLIERQAGSWFFLGEIYTDLPLPVDPAVSEHCGRCRACLDACPTGAIVAPYQVDARRCISYLTIELAGAIPEELRGLLGNRIYGCDDCQLACPWNRFGQLTREPDFAPRHGLDRASLVALFAWTEEDFAQRMAGSAIYRIGYERWLRNIAVALGNAPTSPGVVAALEARAADPRALVQEHVAWALARHGVVPGSLPA